MRKVCRAAAISILIPRDRQADRASYCDIITLYRIVVSYNIICRILIETHLCQLYLGSQSS